MDIPTHDQLIANIDEFLARHPGVSETRLGREATNEPGLIARIRAKGNVTLGTLEKLAAVMAAKDAELAATGAGASPTKDSEDIRTPGVVAAPKATPFVAPSSSTSSTIPEPQASPTAPSSSGPASTEAEAA